MKKSVPRPLTRQPYTHHLAYARLSPAGPPHRSVRAEAGRCSCRRILNNRMSLKPPSGRRSLDAVSVAGAELADGVDQPAEAGQAFQAGRRGGGPPAAGGGG